MVDAGCARVGGEVPPADSDRVPLLATVQTWVAVLNESDVVVIDLLIEPVPHKHALVPIDRAPAGVEWTGNRETAEGDAIGGVDFYEVM